ncbi:MAG: Gfo/Idh/MocA family oxidoreductase [Armatimonadetes bacterium]|nr:Gfo/Idh/MocA family oxidoreductase [Armatimonadota bacterium]
MPYRCAILGCGGRARGHAEAYRLITRGEVVAVCDLDERRLNTFGDAFEVAARYTDLDAMLRREKPDVVHMVTQPTARVGLMARLAEAGVPGVIVEKPVCTGAADYKALRALEARSRTKFVVNHQLRHHPRILQLLAHVAAGRIGEVRFIDASALYPMSGQGVHVLDLMFAFNAYAAPRTVFGAASGYDDINGHHPGPRAAESLITFANGTRAALQAGAGAPLITAQAARAHMHKRIAVYGTHGFVHWRMNGWECSGPGGSAQQGDHVYGEEDLPGQAGLTNALFDWLADDAKTHPNNLATSLDEWLVILASYASAVESRPIDFPFDPADDLLEQLKRLVGAGEPRA